MLIRQYTNKIYRTLSKTDEPLTSKKDIYENFKTFELSKIIFSKILHFGK